MTLRASDDDVRVEPRDFPTNRGGLCQKGWTAAELLRHPDRLTSPLVRDRKGGPLRDASWDEALDRIADEVRRIQSESGPDAVGVFGGGGLTNEKAYALGKFARVALRSSQIDYNGRFCMSSAAAASIKAFGVDRGLPFPVADIRIRRNGSPDRKQRGGDDAARYAVFPGARKKRRTAHCGGSALYTDCGSRCASPSDHAWYRPCACKRTLIHRPQGGICR